LPQAQKIMKVTSSKTGYLTALQCEQIGTACVILGGGRERKEDSVDPSVGIVLHKKVGDAVSAGEALATIHYNDEARAVRAKRRLEESYTLDDAPPRARRPLVHRVIGGANANSGEKN
jgi:pyrimidine-nucleoside phosphorylase